MSWTHLGVLLNLTLDDKKIGDLSDFTENGVSFEMIRSRRHVLLPLQEWGAGNVYLLVLSKAKS